MYFAFKTQPEDFIVEELLPFQLSGKGEFLYVFFEKKLVNTNHKTTTQYLPKGSKCLWGKLHLF